MNASALKNPHLTSATAIRLDPAAYGLDDPEALRLLSTIAKATEDMRSALYSDPNWGASLPSPPRGFATALQRRERSTVADLLPWPALLTMGKCADEAASRAGCERQAIMQTALSFCPIAHWVTLINFMAHDSAILQTAKILSPLIRDLQAKETRIKRGASEGGKKAARTRQSKSRLPDVLQYRQHLLDIGREPKDIAGILAERFEVTPNTIRRMLRTASQRDQT